MSDLLSNSTANMNINTGKNVTRTKIKLVLKNKHLATFASADDFSDGDISVEDFAKVLVKGGVTLHGSICESGPYKDKYVVSVIFDGDVIGWFNHVLRDASLNESDVLAIEKALKAKNVSFVEVRSKAVKVASIKAKLASM